MVTLEFQPGRRILRICMYRMYHSPKVYHACVITGAAVRNPTHTVVLSASCHRTSNG